MCRARKLIILLLILVSGCRENFTLTPSTSPAGATITLTSINLGTGIGQNSLLYDGQQVEIVSWTNNEIKFKVPANKPNGTYTVTLVMKSPNPIETVSKPHTVLNTTTVEFKAYDLDALVGSNIDARALGDAGNMSFCIAFNDQNFQTMHTTVVNSQAGTLSTPVAYNVPGTWPAEANGVSPNCLHIAGSSDPATGWEMGNPDGIDDMAPFSGGYSFTSSANSSGVFVGSGGFLSSAFRWSQSLGSQPLSGLSPLAPEAAVAWAIDSNGNAYGFSIAQDLETTKATMWLEGSGLAVALEDGGNIGGDANNVVYSASNSGAYLGGTTGTIGNTVATIWDNQVRQVVLNSETGQPISGSVQAISEQSGLVVGGGGLSDNGGCGIGQSSCSPGGAFFVVKQNGEWKSYNVRNWLLGQLSYDVGQVATVRGVSISSEYVSLLLSDDRNGSASDRLICIPRGLFQTAFGLI